MTHSVGLALKAASGALIVAASSFGDGPTVTVPVFIDRAEAAGLSVITYSGDPDKDHILESTGNGVLALDYDGDGDQDLYFVNAFRLSELGGAVEYPSTLYRNDGDRFVDVTDTAGVGATTYGHGGCVGDFDSDGLPDIYLTAYGANILYRNNGDGTFSDVTEASGTGDPGWSIGATFFDADGDGDHDLYVGNYIEASWDEIVAARRTRRWRGRVDVMDGPRGLPEAANTFYLNQGDGTFRAATESSGFADGGMGYTMGVTSFDYDRDGDTDLYVANDSSPNRLYGNRGDGTFEEIGAWTGSSHNADGRMQGSMGAGFGDFDGDGWLDLIVTNFAHDHYTLYRNLEGASFQDDSFVRQLSGPSFAPLGWAAVLFDAENDGDEDLFFSNGHIYPQVDDDPTLHESYRQRNQLFLNDGTTFRDVTATAGSGFEIEESSRGASVVDFDNDGDLDIAISNQDTVPTLLVNQTEGGARWLTLELRNDAGRLPLGTRIDLLSGDRRRAWQVGSGGSYASQNDLRPHIGLGQHPVATLTITWPGGHRQLLRDLPADHFVVVPGKKR